MTSVVPDILARIVQHKRRELADAELCQQALDTKARSLSRRDFRAALEAGAPAVIAEVKKGSPSKGLFANRFEPAVIAQTYQKGGAAALSVLTDHQFFHGSLADLEAARAAVQIPALRKDFIISKVQVAESAAWGADAILLITAVLTDHELRDYREYAESFAMAAVVEVHDREEINRAVASGARIIGVNNRDLRTFDVRIETSLELAERIPTGVVRVSESGIHSAADVARLRAAGYSAFLVGEHLMRSGDPSRAIEELRG